MTDRYQPFCFMLLNIHLWMVFHVDFSLFLSSYETPSSARVSLLCSGDPCGHTEECGHLTMPVLALGPVSVSVCSADNTEASVTLQQRAFAKKPNRMRSVVTALCVAFKDCPSGYFCKCVTPTLASWHISITIISTTVFLNKAILYAAGDTTPCRKFSTHFRTLQFSWWRAIAWFRWHG